MLKPFAGRRLPPAWLLLFLLPGGALLRGQSSQGRHTARGAATGPTPAIAIDHGPNTAAQQAKPYVVMVSLDGFRYDYARKYGATHLLALGNRGATAPEGMIPSFPPLTLPNHYSLATGLYPGHHGIVADSFYDPDRKQRFSEDDPATTSDGSWYGGTPLWVLAEKQGMRTACFFWPGSEAEIDGARPTYFLKYDDRVPDSRRIDQVTAWLREPAAARPHLILLDFDEPDHTGRRFGPDSPQTAAAVRHVDQTIGTLWADLSGLGIPIDLIVVSDHGAERTQGGWINLDQYADLSHFITVDALLYPDSEDAAERAYQDLKIKSDAFTVYRRARVPAGFAYNGNAREGDPVVVADGPYAIRAHAPAGGAEQPLPETGWYGAYPRTLTSMRGIFFAAGPEIRPGSKLEPFENVNVYPLAARILGLEAPKVDGSVNVLSGILVDALDPVSTVPVPGRDPPHAADP